MIPGFFHSPRRKLSEAFARHGLTSDLALLLDPGDAASYASGQQWSDLSGAGNHFNRGSTSGAEATDPAFNGAAGGLSASEYFSTDGADLFTPAGAPTFDDPWPQDNATFTVAGMFWLPSAGAGVQRALFGNTQNSTFHGIRLNVSTANRLRLTQVNSVTPSVQTLDSVATVTHDAWNFLAVALSEAGGAGASTHQINGTQEPFNGAYTDAAPGGASSNMAIFGPGALGTTQAPGADTRIGPFALWTRALSAAELVTLYRILRRRGYGI